MSGKNDPWSREIHRKFNGLRAEFDDYTDSVAEILEGFDEKTGDKLSDFPGYQKAKYYLNQAGENPYKGEIRDV